MSEPKRYKVGKIGTTEMIDCVSYEDYASLKAQVERLTKAGDAMAELVEHMETVIDMDCGHEEVEAWNAAKEGKQS